MYWTECFTKSFYALNIQTMSLSFIIMIKFIAVYCIENSSLFNIGTVQHRAIYGLTFQIDTLCSVDANTQLFASVIKFTYSNIHVMCKSMWCLCQRSVVHSTLTQHYHCLFYNTIYYVITYFRILKQCLLPCKKATRLRVRWYGFNLFVRRVQSGDKVLYMGARHWW